DPTTQVRAVPRVQAHDPRRRHLGRPVRLPDRHATQRRALCHVRQGEGATRAMSATTAEITVTIPGPLWFTSNDLRGTYRKWAPKTKQLRAIGKSAAIAAGTPSECRRTIGSPLWKNRSAPEGAVNTPRGLTRSSVLAERG